MRKNVASQVIAAQLVSATDGSAVTSGTTTVYVTKDGGTQASGGGTVTHEGQGCWSYVPTQAETNAAHVAFTFVNSSACAVTVNVYPVAYDPGDTVRMGLTALPPAAADAPGGLPISDAGGLDLDARLDTSISSRLATASYSAPLDAAGTRTAVGLASANLDTQLADIPTVSEMNARTLAAADYATAAALAIVDDFLDTEIGAIKAKTDLIPASPAAVGSAMTLEDGAITAAKVATGAIDADAIAADAANEIADAILDRSSAIEGYTLRQTMRLVLSALVAKLSGGATTTNTVRDVGDTKDRIVATVDADGNRTAVTLDAT